MFPKQCMDATKLEEASQRFTFCTLVTRLEQYTPMINSMIAGGFDTTRARYLYVDNTQSNSYEAYAGLNLMIAKALTPYIVLCHQDLTLLDDGYDVLMARLGELDALDPNWAVAGNAGGVSKGKYAMHITSRDGKITKLGTLPTQVESLDENFIVLKRSALLGFSRDLAGFHLYGTDIVIQARMRGFSSYAINFHLHHHGEGKMDASFYHCQEALERKYYKLFQTRYLQGTCRRIVLTSSRLRLAVQLFRARRKLKRMQQ